MADSLLNAIFAAVDFVFDVSVAIDDTKRLRQAEIVEVPPDPKPLPSAAQRALSEAEERERAREQTASATVCKS